MRVAAPVLPPSTSSMWSRSAPGASARIQSRESTCSLAMALAMKWRRWPKSDVMPYQRTAKGACAPRRKTSGAGFSPLGRSTKGAATQRE